MWGGGGGKAPLAPLDPRLYLRYSVSLPASLPAGLTPCRPHSLPASCLPASCPLASCPLASCPPASCLPASCLPASRPPGLNTTQTTLKCIKRPRIITTPQNSPNAPILTLGRCSLLLSSYCHHIPELSRHQYLYCDMVGARVVFSCLNKHPPVPHNRYLRILSLPHHHSE